jgi:hypothetical protein
MREWLDVSLHIDGRQIPYRLVTARDYFESKGYGETEIEDLYESPIGELVTQIMGLKQSIFLLRHTSHSCGSLPDTLFFLKMRLIFELKEKYQFVFDDDLVETYGK